MKNAAFALTSWILCALFTGCASLDLPSQNETDTVLIVPSRITNGTNEGWTRLFSLQVIPNGQKEEIQIPIPQSGDPYFIVTKVPAGKYQLTGIEWRWATGWRPAGGGSLGGGYRVDPIDFELKSNSATILQKVVSVIQENNGGFIYSQARIEELKPSKAALVRTEVKKHNNHNWAIEESTKESAREIVEVKTQDTKNRAIEQADAGFGSLIGVPSKDIANELRTGAQCYLSKDFKCAMKHLRPLAEQGSAAAQTVLGGMYYSGLGIERDFFEAVRWSRLAAEQKMGVAQFFMGVAYFKGEGVRQEKSEAKKYFGDACDSKIQKGCDEYRKINEGYQDSKYELHFDSTALMKKFLEKTMADLSVTQK